jgi:acetyl-CoA acyltransferase 1
MYVYCLDKLQLDREKVNVRGGAIALGHPLGCTGTRQVVTALSELRRRKQKIAVTSMCVGTGMGVSTPPTEKIVKLT